MPLIPDVEVDATTKRGIDDNIPGLLDPLSTSSPQKSTATLLAPFTPVVFVEAKDSSLNADLEANKYEPINVPSVQEPLVKLETDTQSNGKAAYQPSIDATNATPSVSDTKSESKAIIPLDTYRLSPNWPFPQFSRMICGLDNLGNSCFMNSTLQILMHTPQLFNILVSHHPRDSCPLLNDKGFCFTCSLKRLFLAMWPSKTSRPKAPTEIFDNIRKIAPSFRRGRQEDAHEFLRFSIDALQLSAQKGVKDVAEKLAETSWVYRLFGGKFRSRVNCTECNYNSDTFDTLLDLSVDVGRCETLTQALKKFAAVEKLEGKNKYKCEKCNKPVNARKQITVHSAPYALCIQLKRFTPWGRKLTHPVEYPNVLDLDAVMSQGETSAPYKLYGIICHAGGTPNSGHYYAFVKNPGNGWSRMNDEDALSLESPPYDIKTAYMLFYMREPSSIDSVIAKATALQEPATTPLSGQKRKREDRPFGPSLEEDLGERLDNKERGLSSEEKASPSLAKKPRIARDGPRAILNVASTQVQSKYRFANPHPSIPVIHRKVDSIRPKGIISPIKNKDLGLTYGSSDAEDQDDTPVQPEPVQSSQTDDATSPPVSSLPASRETSPEPSNLPISAAWQKPISTAFSSRTQHDSPPSSSDSQKRKPWELDEKHASNGLTRKPIQSEDDVPVWASESGGPRKHPHKMYRSNVRKEKNGRSRHLNPYGNLGQPNSTRPIGGVKMSPNKSRRFGI